jgi:PAS domain S-box-containing protein
MNAKKEERNQSARYKELQQRLESERLLLQTLIDNVPDHIFQKDREGRYLLVNRSLANDVGARDPTDIIGKTDRDVFAPEIADNFISDDRVVVESEKPLFNSEQPLITASGSLRWVLTTKVPLLDEAGSITGLIGIGRDITDRKFATEGLKESEEKFHLLFEQSADGNLILDNGRFVECNEAALRIAGFTVKEQLIGLGPVDISPEYQPDSESSADKAERMITLAYENGFHYFEWMHRRFNGSELALEVLLTAIPVKGRRLLHVSWRDISARKRAEEALRESEERYRSLVENSNESIFVAQDGMLRYVNRAGVQMGGYSEQEVFSKPFLELIHPDDRARIGELHLKRLRDEKVQSRNSFRIICKNGDIKWVELGGALIQFEERPAVLSIATDITERKQAEEMLRESERRLSDIVNFLPDATFAIDTEGTITTWNRAIEQMTGKTKEQMLGCRNYEYAIPFYGRRRPILIDLTLENREETKEKYSYVERSGDTLTAEVFTPLLHEGKGAHLWGIATLLRNEKGMICGAIESIRDITDRKRAEEEKARLEAQLQQAQKMESVGRLAGGVAHDFNNMLVVILGHTEMALEQVDPAQPLHADLEEIRKAAERSASLTRQLLAFARKQTIAPKVLDLNQTVEGMLTMLERLIGEDVHLSWLPKADLWPVIVDRSQIDQLLTNLCVNARDAIADVGKITIETGNSAIDEAYCADHAGFMAGEYVLLAVTDDGCGMDKETLSHLFEPFFTTKEMGKGTGLGLATVYGIVKQNNGFINVYSEPGHGTRFTIHLPRHSGKTEQARGIEAEGPALRGQETILLVEDEPASLKLITKMLERQGYSVLAAGTPGEAIRVAREHSGEIHLLLTDVVMPEMNGRDLARRLLSLYPNLKRLFASGYTANVIAHQGVLDEGMHFIQKPFSRKELAAKVREALDSE